MNDNDETRISVPKLYSGRRQSTGGRRNSFQLTVSEEDEATVPTNGNNKDITVQNNHSRHSLPDLPSGDCSKSSCKHDPWYYSSNHVLINQERVERGLSPLHRRRLLDEKARDLAKSSAEKRKVKRLPNGCKGNIARGATIREIHWDMMTKFSDNERKKILSDQYNAFGMGTHKGEDGRLYLVQLFEKIHIDQ